MWRNRYVRGGIVVVMCVSGGKQKVRFEHGCEPGPGCVHNSSQLVAELCKSWVTRSQYALYIFIIVQHVSRHTVWHCIRRKPQLILATPRPTLRAVQFPIKCVNSFRGMEGVHEVNGGCVMGTHCFVTRFPYVLTDGGWRGVGVVALVMVKFHKCGSGLVCHVYFYL